MEDDIIDGNLVSVWDAGVEISTPATLHPRTGEVISDQVDVEGLDILESEHFVDFNGDMIPICQSCHNYILKTIMREGIGKSLFESLICSDPDCESNQE